MRFWLTLLLIYSTLVIQGQTNLVPNPSFEDFSTCPSLMGDFFASNWFSPNDNTPDYFNACCTIPYPSGADVPKNFPGFQYSKTGDAYVGILVFLKDEPNNGRDYIACKLIDSLTANQSYCISFYVSLANNSIYSIYDLSVFFSNTNPYASTTYELPYTPQIVSNRLFTDSLSWMKFEAFYTAIGGEQFITIGNFKDNLTTAYDSVNHSVTLGTYYYIDDVSVTECDPPTPILILPNIFTPNNDGHNDVLIFENLPEQSHLSIFNRWGNLMYEKSNYANDWRAEDVSDGVYFYILKLPSGESKHGTIQIIR